MEHSATQSVSFGEGFVTLVVDNGSVPVSGPLISFLDRCMAAPALRKTVKDSLPALLADVAHFLNVSHGRFPGVVDHAASKIGDLETRAWLKDATTAFATERTLLNSLTVAAGPIRRHLDQDKIEALLAIQQRSLEMLATSDRKGCPAGAAMAFVLDWHATRPMLDRAALMLGVDAPHCTLPELSVTVALADSLAGKASIARAITFGGEQLLAQQKGLWRLIAARHHNMTTL